MSQVSLKQRLQDKIECVRKECDTSRNPSARILNQDQYVRLAYQQLDLDIEQPEDQIVLLRALGRALHAGGPLKPDRYLNNLILDAEAIVKKHGLTGGKRESVKRLKLDGEYRHKYEDYTENTLLQHMKDALNRDKNPYYDELVKGRPTRELYSRTVFAPRMEMPIEVNESPALEPASPARRAKQVREGLRRRPKRKTRHPILKWIEGRVYIVVYQSW